MVWYGMVWYGYTSYNKLKSCFFRPAGRFRDGLARQISAPLASADGESTGDPSVASLALALWPAQRALNVEKNESVSRDAPPSPRCRAGDVKPALRQSHPRKKKIQSIPYIYLMNNDLLHQEISRTRTSREDHTHPCALIMLLGGAHRVAAGT